MRGLLLALVVMANGCYLYAHKLSMDTLSNVTGCPKEKMIVKNEKGKTVKAVPFGHFSLKPRNVTCEEPKATYTCIQQDGPGYVCELTEEAKRALGERKASFVESEYAPYAAPGSATIQGQAFLKTRGGDVKYGAGNDIVVTPATSYSTEFWERSVKGEVDLNAEDSRVGPYLRIATADGEGRFKASNLPAGQYYAYTYISWEVPSSSGLKKTGGWVGAKITVVDGAVVDTILKSVE